MNGLLQSEQELLEKSSLKSLDLIAAKSAEQEETDLREKFKETREAAALYVPDLGGRP